MVEVWNKDLQDFAIEPIISQQICYLVKPKKLAHKKRQKGLFRIEFVQIIDHGHSLVRLANVVDWDRFEELFGSTYYSDNGRLAVSTRLMVALHYLKYTHNLSNDDVFFTRLKDLLTYFLSASLFINTWYNALPMMNGSIAIHCSHEAAFRNEFLITSI